MDPADRATVGGRPLSWALALAYVAAAGLLLAASLGRADPVVARRLGALAGDREDGRLLSRVVSRIHGAAARMEASRRLVEAGRHPDEADRVAVQRGVLAAAGATAGISAWTAAGPAAVALAVVLAWTGSRLPLIRLARAAASRGAEAAARLPDLLDLLAISVSAGLSQTVALERSPEAIGGPLGEILAAARGEVDLGRPWRSALRDAAQRSGLRDLQRLAVTLERSDRLGTPVGDRLRSLAREVRAERRARREERARRAPVTMLFPLVFLILPAFVLAAVVPAVLVATRDIS